MKYALRHHNKRVSSPARNAAWTIALAALFLAAFAAAAPLHPASRQEKPKPSTPSTRSEHSPYLATQDVDVGKFYRDKGKYDAAISRFKGAVRHDPEWALPHKLLGEAYEKKDDPKHAVAEYREYLKITPYAKDAKKIEKRIRQLTRKIKQQSAEDRR